MANFWPHHVKHGIAAFLLGMVCLIFAWFQTGPAATAGGGGRQAPIR